MGDFLTTNLKLELEKTNQQFHRWATEHKEWLSRTQEEYDVSLEELECTIQALQRTNIELDGSKPVQLQIKAQQESDLQQAKAHQDELKNQLQAVEKQFQTLQIEELEATQRLNALKLENERLKQQMEHKLHDFTYGIQHFLHLGLEFQKASNDCMKFSFINIDPNLSSRVFSFVIFVDNSNLYQLVETLPQLKRDDCLRALNELNTTNNIAKFVVTIRKMFLEYVKSAGVI
jgi:DNA repair exonuclease SbcCD ATPase subunit